MIDFSQPMGAEIPQEAGGEVIKGELATNSQAGTLVLWNPGFFEKILVMVRQDFEIYRPDMDALVEKALALQVTSEESDQLAVQYGSEAQGLKGKLEKRCAFIVDEPNAFVTTIRGLKNGFVNSLEEIKKDLGRKRDAFIAAERKRKEALRLQAEKEARELQEKLYREAREKAEAEAKRLAEEEAKKRGVPVEQVEVVIAPVEEVFIPAPIVEQPKTTVRSSSGSGTGYQKKQLYIEVVDFSKIDDKYKILVDTAAIDTLERPRGLIKDDFKAGVREFAGLIVEEREKSQFRSK